MKVEKIEQVKDTDRDNRQLISRREAIALLGAAGTIWLISGRPTTAQAASSAPRSLCIVRPEQTEGPYFVDERLYRTDIRADPTDGRIKPGTPLTLIFQVMGFRAGNCQPIPDAQVDIWHCDAKGLYSDVEDPEFNTVGKKFLRGYQVTDAGGEARFFTIYPGWYPIRTVHIHFKIRTAPVAARRLEFTSQLYFPEEVTDLVHTGLAYSSMGPRRVRNRQDFIFRHGGDHLMLAPTESAGRYTAIFSIGLQL